MELNSLKRKTKREKVEGIKGAGKR